MGWAEQQAYHEAGEPERLAATADLLAAVPGPAPSIDLRARVLAAAHQQRSPGVAGVRELTEPLAEQVAALDDLLSALRPHQLRLMTGRHGDAAGVLAHLTANDAALAADLGLDCDYAADAYTRDRYTRDGDSGSDADDPGSDAELPLLLPTGTLTITRTWRERADRLLVTLSALDDSVLDRPVRLAGVAGLRRPARQALVQRTFETWTHRNDLERLVGRVPGPIGAVAARQIVNLAMDLLPTALRAAGVHRPGEVAILDLSGVAAGAWRVRLGGTGNGDDAHGAVVTTISADSLDFCRLVANRESPDRLAHRVVGDRAVATRLLTIATTLGCD